MLHIVEQDYKETKVQAKPVSWFPKTDEMGDVVGFGKLGATYIRVLFNYDRTMNPSTSWKLTMNAATGMMNLTPPMKRIPATLVSPETWIPDDYNGSAKKSSGQKTSDDMVTELKRNGFPNDFIVRLLQVVQDGLTAYQEECEEAAELKAANKAEKQRIKDQKANAKREKAEAKEKAKTDKATEKEVAKLAKLKKIADEKQAKKDAKAAKQAA